MHNIFLVKILNVCKSQFPVQYSTSQDIIATPTLFRLPGLLNTVIFNVLDRKVDVISLISGPEFLISYPLHRLLVNERESVEK